MSDSLGRQSVMVSNLGFHVMHMYALYTAALSSQSFGIHERDSDLNLCRGGVLRILFGS